MKDIQNSPFIDSDSDMEQESDGSSSDGEDLRLEDVDEDQSDPEDNDYSPSDSEASSSDSSGSSIPSGEDEVLSDIEENSNEHEGAEVDEPEPMSVQEASDNEDIRMPMDEGAVRSPRANFLAEQLANAKFDECLPDTCKVEFENNKLDAFKVTVTPNAGYWQGGKFQFDVNYPKDYQLAPPLVKCKSNTFHPMISKDGILGLKILRPTLVGDKGGWHAGRQMKEIVLALNAMFSDPIEVNEPRNEEAAELLQKDQAEFAARVKNCIAGISQ